MSPDLTDMGEEVEEHLAAIEALYRPVILDPRLTGGAKLWRQYEQARDAYRRGDAAKFLPVFERINEMAVARISLTDPTLAGAAVAYEPKIAADGSRIDFVVIKATGETIYIEVKTIHPELDDSEASWLRHEKRRERFAKDTHLIVGQGFMGAALSDASFKARSKFMDYTREFERRLAAARKVRPGRGVLVFCTNGRWRLDELEDFADFYETSAHRLDDRFSDMEAHSIAKEGVELRRNIDAFGYVKRPMERTTPEKWFADVRGPEEFRGRPPTEAA